VIKLMKEVMTQFWSTTIGGADGREDTRTWDVAAVGVEKVGVPRVFG